MRLRPWRRPHAKLYHSKKALGCPRACREVPLSLGSAAASRDDAATETAYAIPPAEGPLAAIAEAAIASAKPPVAAIAAVAQAAEATVPAAVAATPIGIVRVIAAVAAIPTIAPVP